MSHRIGVILFKINDFTFVRVFKGVGRMWFHNAFFGTVNKDVVQSKGKNACEVFVVKCS
jgi:hypothetical protein